MGFQISALDGALFSALFDLSDEALEQAGAKRYFADAKPGYPCRVSLADAAIGEELVLFSYPHQAEATPFAAAGPIFVRRDAAKAELPANVIPELLRSRMLSVRGYGSDHMMNEAEVCEGVNLEPLIAQMFAGGQCAYLHVHMAKRGCYVCRIDPIP